MNSSKIEEFFKKFNVIHYKKHETILRAEEIPQGVYYLKKGYVRDYAISEQGDEFSFVIFKPGDLFPMGWVINNEPFVHYLESLTQTEIFRVPKDKFISFIKENPEVLFLFTKRMLYRLMGLMDRVEHMAFGNAHQKLASILIICAVRFGVKEGKNTTIQVPLTHKDLANLVGLTRETVSLELKKFQTENLISYRGKNIIIKNLRKMRNESLMGHQD